MEDDVHPHPPSREYAYQLLRYLHQSYCAPLPYKPQIEADEQVHIVASVRKKTDQHRLIILFTDKSNNFYIGSAIEFEKKLQKSFADTNAFTELSNNPLDEVLNNVIQLLNYLRSKKLILKWQYKKMMPDRTKSELAHLRYDEIRP